jgi:hypothetical protein
MSAGREWAAGIGGAVSSGEVAPIDGLCRAPARNGGWFRLRHVPYPVSIDLQPLLPIFDALTEMRIAGLFRSPMRIERFQLFIAGEHVTWATAERLTSEFMKRRRP